MSAETGALPVYGRRLLCIHETISQVEQRRFNSACRATRMAQRCPYYPGRPKAVKESSVGSLKEHGRRLMTCPYEIQMVSIPASKALVATHRQLSVIGWLFAKWRWSRERTLLVLDEAQHILRGVLEMTKDSISLKTLKKAAKEARRYGFNDVANELKIAVEEYSRYPDGEHEVEDALPDINELEAVGEEVQDMKMRENIVPASHVLTVADFKLALAGQKPLLVREGERVFLEATADPRDELRRIYDGWRAVITMTATLDAELVERLTGSEVTLLRAGWPFEEDNLRAYVVTGITTRYPQRDEQLYEDAGWLIGECSKTGKLLVFTPAYEVSSEILRRCDGGILVERAGMSQEEAETVAAEFSGDGGRVLMTVYGGRLSEGVDLPSDIVLMIGVPFARPTPRSQKLLKTLKSYGFDEDEAWLHGVALPALFSAVQAAGRAVRGPEDRALVLMADDRYRRLLRFLPRWFRERVSDQPVKLVDVPMVLERLGRGWM
ncbi:MAG: helicase C-terminal domain-containing protein [Candidatus Caldarchaeum sp.]